MATRNLYLQYSISDFRSVSAYQIRNAHEQIRNELKAVADDTAENSPGAKGLNREMSV